MFDEYTYVLFSWRESCCHVACRCSSLVVGCAHTLGGLLLSFLTLCGPVDRKTCAQWLLLQLLPTLTHDEFLLSGCCCLGHG